VTRYRDKIHTEMRHREVYETRDTGGKKLHRRRRGGEEIEEEIPKDNIRGRGWYPEMRGDTNRSGIMKSTEDKKIQKF
jgi:hypothetical protein